MLSYFRINDPYKLAFILLFLIGIRFTIFLGEYPAQLAELKWMVIGERLAEGSNLYVDVWDNIAPLSAATYRIINELFGRSPLANHIIALLLVFIQAFMFNNIMLKHRAYNENTYLPALIYAVLMNIFYDFYLLSPVLMGMTFILMAIDNVITHLSDSRNDQLILYTGIYFGIANLFYYPTFLVLIAVFVAFTFLTGTIIRRYLLLTFGYILPLAITGIYYYLLGGVKEFYVNFIFSIFNVSAINYVSPFFYLIVFILPILFVLFAIFQTFKSLRYTNQQERIQKLVILLLMFSLLGWFINKDRAPFQLIIMVPGAAFFLTHYFLNIRVKWKAEAVFAVFIVLLLITNIITYQKSNFIQSRIDYSDIKVKDSEWDNAVRGKKIMYLGLDHSIFQHASLGSPYFNWDLAKLHLERPTYFDNLTAIYRKFESEYPEVIIDEKGIMNDVLEKMPTINRAYTKEKNGKLYILKDKKPG